MLGPALFNICIIDLDEVMKGTFSKFTNTVLHESIDLLEARKVLEWDLDRLD